MKFKSLRKVINPENYIILHIPLYFHADYYDASKIPPNFDDFKVNEIGGFENEHGEGVYIVLETPNERK